MSNKPRTIQIFLPDGNARSIRIAEITSRNVQAIFVPRTKIAEAGKRDEVKSVGLYFLFGEDENTGQRLVYIGEAEDCHNRIAQHNRKKAFWESAVVITSKTKSFTKAHVKYLEWYCHQEIVATNRFLLDNSTVPAKPYISEQIEADLMDNYETISVLLSTIGFPVLEKVVAVERPSEMLYCKGRGVEAKGQYTDDGFIVFQGSEGQPKLVPSAGTFVKNTHQRLVDSGTVEIKNGKYIFTKDYLFPSPSQAAVAILGRSTNGWTRWKDSKGQTLHDLKRK